MTDILNYSNEVERVVKKYGQGKTESEKSDLRNDIYLALLEASDKITGKAYAYTVAKNKALELATRKNQKAELVSINENEIVRKMDKGKQERFIFEGIEHIELDKLIERLPQYEKIAILCYIKNPELFKALAGILEKPPDFFIRKKNLAIKKLKNMVKNAYKCKANSKP